MKDVFELSIVFVCNRLADLFFNIAFQYISCYTFKPSLVSQTPQGRIQYLFKGSRGRSGLSEVWNVVMMSRSDGRRKANYVISLHCFIVVA